MYPELFVIPGLNIAVPSYGAMMMLGFLVATWLAARRAVRLKINPDIILNLGFILLIFGAAGARALYVIRHWDAQFAHQPGQILNLRAGGLVFYGGLIGAFTAAMLYLWIKGYSKRLFSDLVAPSLLLAMGIGRIGCFLYGCCWGGTCPAELPWSVRFPFASPPMLSHWEARQVHVPAELLFVAPDGSSGPLPAPLLRLDEGDLRKLLDDAEQRIRAAQASGDAGRIRRADELQAKLDQALRPLLVHYEAYGKSPSQLADQARAPAYASLHVHPAQVYGAIGPILLGILLGAYLYRRQRHGMVMVVGMGLYSVQRFIEEAIRTDTPQVALGLTGSQWISVLILLLAAGTYLLLQRLPMRSPRVDASRLQPAVQESAVTTEDAPAG